MKIRIAKEILVKGLAKIQSIASSKTSMPILSNLLLEAKGNSISITATDLEVGLKTSYPAEVIKEGSITLNAKKLFEIVKELPNEEIALTRKENDWVNIICGKARFDIVGLPVDEFPAWSKEPDKYISIGSEILAEMIGKVSHSICTDETKYHLNGVFFQTSDSVLRMVATDGFRMSAIKKPFEGEISEKLTKGVILPKKGVHELEKLAIGGTDEEQVKIAFIDNIAVFRREDTIMTMRLIDGEFPNYQRVIPKENDKSIVIEKGKLLPSLKRMALIIDGKSRGFNVEISSGNMVMSASAPELGECREEIELVYQGEAFSTKLNPKYLMDVVNAAIIGEVELMFRDAATPLLMRSPGIYDFISVIMPMRA